MNNKTQNQEILEYLQTGNTITPIDALNKFGCFRLGARIYDLKRQGYDIKTIPVKANGKHFAKYELINPVGCEQLGLF